MKTMQDGNIVKRGRGRPPKFDAQALVELERIARENPSIPLVELADVVERELGIRVSRGRLRERLKELGFTRVLPSGTATPADEPPRAATRYGYADRHRKWAEEAAYPHGLSDAEWALVADIFEDKPRGVPRRYSRRSMVDAMSYVVRGGIPWRMLPHEFPPWHQVYKTFRRWSEQGRFERMYDRLRGMWRKREGRSPEPTAAVIDAQSVKTSAQGGPKGYDGGKRVKGRKRHLVTDVLGLLIAVSVHAANIQDAAGADAVVQAAMEKAPTISMALLRRRIRWQV